VALLQISEPGQSTKPHEHKFAIGIDLGTTNSLVAAVRSGQSDTLADANGEHLLPSVVQYTETEIIVGGPAKQKQIEDPHNTISSVKRLMGRGVDDLRAQFENLSDVLPYEFVATDSAVPKIKTRGGNKTAIEVSADILKELKQKSFLVLYI